MNSSDDPVDEVIAAYIEHIEAGLSPPDLSKLSNNDRLRAEQLLDVLQKTRGLDLGNSAEDPTTMQKDQSEESAIGRDHGPVEDVLRQKFRPPHRVLAEAAPELIQQKIPVLEAWLVGTLGGRFRVFRVDARDENALQETSLRAIAALFAWYQETSVVLLVADDLSCLVITPEDCAPALSAPSGELTARGCKLPPLALDLALSLLHSELVPTWESVDLLAGPRPLPANRADILSTFVERAVQEQVETISKSRNANKKAALATLGKAETLSLTDLISGLLDGSVHPDAVPATLDDLAEASP